jgi:hypothetical protein
MTRGGDCCISTISFFQVKRLRQTFIQFMPSITSKIRIAPVFVLLSAVPAFWFVLCAIAPELVQAYTARGDLAIDRLPEENYETLLRRAEAAARAATQRTFDQDILVTDVSIIVSVQNYGAIAPVLELAVSRPQWRTIPDPQRWATYFKTARSLLFLAPNFSTPNVAQPSTPTPTASPAQPSTPTPATQPNNTAPPKASSPDLNKTRRPIIPPQLLPVPPTPPPSRK